MSEVRLNEFSKAEWFDVSRLLKPGLTWEEFSDEWDEFQKMKAEHLRQKALS